MAHKTLRTQSVHNLFQLSYLYNGLTYIFPSRNDVKQSCIYCHSNIMQINTTTLLYTISADMSISIREMRSRLLYFYYFNQRSCGSAESRNAALQGILLHSVLHSVVEYRADVLVAEGIVYRFAVAA